MAIIAIIFIARSYRLSRKNAKDLSLKNKLIAEKNKEITDSINYAKNIQQSLLTHEKKFKDNLKDYYTQWAEEKFGAVRTLYALNLKEVPNTLQKV